MRYFIGLAHSTIFVIACLFWLKLGAARVYAASSTGTPDYADSVVNGTDDLKDFFPVFLDLKQLLTTLPPSGSVKYKLKQEDAALNFVYTNLTRANAYGYLSAPSTGFGPAFTQPAASAITQQIVAEGIELSADFLSRIKDQDQGVILVEGRQLTDKPLKLVIEKDGSIITEVPLYVLGMRWGRLWETKNKANQLVNRTPKDDPWGGDGYGGYGTAQNGAPLNLLFLVPDPQDSKYKATVEIGIPASFATGFRAAAYLGNDKIAGSDHAFDAQGRCEIEFEHPASAGDIADFVIRTGRDSNSNGQLDAGETDPYTIKDQTKKPLGEPTIRGTKVSKYSAAKQSIDNIVDGDWTSPGWATGLVLPHAKRFLQLFRDGSVSASFPQDKRPTSSTTVPFDAFNGYFAEWLTHNSGAQFDDVGTVAITEYTWGPLTSAADLIATSPQIEDPLRAFYSSTVSPLATSYFVSLPVGSSAYFPANPEDFYDIPHTQESPAWVPATTVTFDSLLPNIIDDVNGTIGRGRILSHQARYRVEKRLVDRSAPEGPPLLVEELVVTEVFSQGTVIDLYDFNHLTGGAGQDAAILQIGFGKGAYGGERNRGKIYRDRIEFRNTYTGLP